MSKKNKYPKIRAELKQREAESRTICKQIRESSGLDRWGFWEAKRTYGNTTRWLLLSYAFLRGIPYFACERKTANRPYEKTLAKILQDQGIEVDSALIKVWLETSAPQAPAVEQVAA
jgi:hypothetical protein